VPAGTISLSAVTLRTRTLIASGVALVALLLMGLVLLAQYTLTAATSIALQTGLSPAVDTTATLALEQSNASGALADYIMLSREASLDEYRQTIGRATTLIDELKDSVADDAELTDLVAAVRAAQRGWVKTDAEPSITLMEAGKRTRAIKETSSPESWAAYDTMTAATAALQKSLNSTRDEAADAVGNFTGLLGVSLLVVGLLVLLGLVAAFTGLQSWVLAPLSGLREDIQRAAREPGHMSPIRPIGPPELKAVGIDAELLRRGLVREIDEAQAAREGLVQDAPLVAAMQAELRGSPVSSAPGLVVAGSMQSAEGVVAGDWWDAVTRPDGTVAVVVADVSGHGPEASVTAVRVRSIVRAALQAGIAPDAVMSMAASACSDDEHFVTAIVLVLDAEGGALSWCNAGHHPAIVVTRDKEASLCEPTGPLISALGGEWTMRARLFEPGDVVVAFTDGLVESRNADGDELESSKVSQFIRGMDGPVRENPEELISRLLAQVRHRAADWRRDDVTLVAAARRH
jgi:serine phosphatase RsbU (regulator of sigma subunit)/CHASE3 domain sensor protein